MPTSSSPALHISKSTIPRKSRSKTRHAAISETGKPTTTVDQLMKIQQNPSKVIGSNESILVKKVWYRECRKNHAARVGRHAVDGCREFMASGEEGTAGALNCAACSCHRSFHKREVEREVLGDCSSNTASPRS